LLLAAGLAALALLPSASRGFAAAGLALCGAGLGLAVPVLTQRAVRPDDGLVHDRSITVGAPHAGLVVALALGSPLPTHRLDHAQLPLSVRALGATGAARARPDPRRQESA